VPRHGRKPGTEAEAVTPSVNRKAVAELPPTPSRVAKCSVIQRRRRDAVLRLRNLRHLSFGMGRFFAFNCDGMKVRLTRKHAERIDGIDLRGREPGDLLDLPPREAQLIVAEQWAIPERRQRDLCALTRRRADDYPDSDEVAS
jgi:hypothetical protein